MLGAYIHHLYPHASTNRQAVNSFPDDVNCMLCIRCTKIINADSEDPKYIINVKQFAKFVVDLSDQVAPTDIEEGMRVG